MTRRSPARLLAPLALVAVAAALFVVVSNGSGGSGDESADAREQQRARSGRATTTPAVAGARGTRRRSTYRVRAGDTPSGIAERTGISVERLLELNPDLDAQALTVGQRLKLR